MSSKQTIEPRAEAKQQKRLKRVSVTLPSDLSRRVSKFARTERRLFAPALVVLIEKGLGAVSE